MFLLTVLGKDPYRTRPFTQRIQEELKTLDPISPLRTWKVGGVKLLSTLLYLILQHKFFADCLRCHLSLLVLLEYQEYRTVYLVGSTCCQMCQDNGPPKIMVAPLEHWKDHCISSESFNMPFSVNICFPITKLSAEIVTVGHYQVSTVQ